MNRLALVEQLVALDGHVTVLNWFLANEPDDDKVRVEFEGRVDRIESRLAQIRGTLSGPADSWSAHVRDDKSNVRTFRDRPGGDAA